MTEMRFAVVGADTVLGARLAAAARSRPGLQLGGEAAEPRGAEAADALAVLGALAGLRAGDSALLSGLMPSPRGDDASGACGRVRVCGGADPLQREIGHALTTLLPGPARVTCARVLDGGAGGLVALVSADGLRVARANPPRCTLPSRRWCATERRASASPRMGQRRRPRATQAWPSSPSTSMRGASG